MWSATGGGSRCSAEFNKWPIPQPVYWMRWFTRGMPEPRATRCIEWYVPKALATSDALGKIPGVGRWLRRLVPVADSRDRLDERQQLDGASLREWAVMDTHDTLITRYTHPQRWKDLKRWMRGLDAPRRAHPREMAAVAVKPW